MEGRKNVTKAGVMRYTGPVKCSYQSPQTIMSLKKSAFIPSSSSPGHYDLLSRHMEAHYKRIAAAAGKTDTSIPESLLKCTKVKDQAGKSREWRGIDGGSSRSSSHFSRHSSRISLQSKSQMRTSSRASRACYSDAGFVSMTGSLESIHIVDDVPGGETSNEEWHDDTNRRDSRMNFRDLLTPEDVDTATGFTEKEGLATSATSRLGQQYEYLLESPMDEGRKWQFYHTRTGQLTGYKQYQQRQSPQSSPSKDTFLAPWKPAFSANSPHSHTSFYPSLSEGSVMNMQIPQDCLPTHQRKTSPGKKATFRESDEKESQILASSDAKMFNAAVGKDAVPLEASGEASHIAQTQSLCLQREASGSGQSEAIVAERESDKAYTDEAPSEHQVSEPVIEGSSLPTRTATASALGVSLKGINIFASTAELRLQSQALDKRSQERKSRVEQNLQEYEYLDFVSEVTRDILSRGILSDSAMALLFKSHIERNKHRLREDVMLERIESLKKELGISG